MPAHSLRSVSAKPLLILGAGGHARVLLDTLLLQGCNVIGLLDPDTALWGKSLRGISVLGGDEKILEHEPASIELVNGLGSTHSTGPRQRLFENWQAKGYRFASVIHPQAILAPDVQLGEGVQIMAGAILNTAVQLADNAVVNTGAILEHDCIIAKHVHISPGACLAGNVRIGQGAHVGLRAVVLQNLELGEACLVAAGAVVIHSVAAGQTVMGIPAKVKA
jgi:UDP-perosamine 4-acetyltransferase